MGEGQFTVFIMLYLLFLYILLFSPFMLLHYGGGIQNQFCCNTVYSVTTMSILILPNDLHDTVMAVTGSHTCSHRETLPAALHHCADMSTAR